MKKLLAILLSVLMLCTLIPFAAVSAEGEPTIVVSTVEEANAGDEIEVSVQLLNNPGVIAAGVKIVYDSDVMELCTKWEYDEDLDEDVEMNAIEVAKGWSSKYITFGPLGNCLVNFTNGAATRDVVKEDYFTATFKIKDDAVSGTYPLTIEYNPKNFFNLAGDDVVFGKQDTTIVIKGVDPEPPACTHEYDNDFDVDCNLCGAIRVMAEDEIVSFNGNSVSENKNGLAFKFDAKISGLEIAEDYKADYTNAKVYINGEEYNLVNMGAVLNNKGLSNCSLDDVNGVNVLNIEANKVVGFDDGSYSYFIRILNIPAEKLDTVITARSYYIYANDAGETFTVYGDDMTASYNQIAL